MEDVVTSSEHLASFAGTRVFLTGHTGFKGAWLATWLTALGAEVHGFALAPPTEPSMFVAAKVEAGLASSTIADIRDAEALRRALDNARPTHVIHMAAQPLVRLSYDDPVETFEVNVMGTVHLLEAVRHTPTVVSCVVVTSDKCYENLEWEYAYREPDAMGGKDPYSASKGATELVAASYGRSFLAERGVGLATVRAGNVIGGGDWALDRIVPDCVRALVAHEPISIRNPRAVRPWQHVLEPLAGYLRVSALLADDQERWAGAWNFGPHPEGHVDVGSIADLAVAAWGTGSWKHDAPAIAPAEANLLRLDASKAMTQLGWSPVWTVENAVSETIAWYRAHDDDDDMHRVSLEQIKAFEHRGTWAPKTQMAGRS